MILVSLCQALNVVENNLHELIVANELVGDQEKTASNFQSSMTLMDERLGDLVFDGFAGMEGWV